MEAEVDRLIPVIVEGEVGHFLLPLPAGQTRVVVVATIPSLAVAVMAMRELEVRVPGDRVVGLIVLVIDGSEHDRARSPVRSFHQAMIERSQSHRSAASSSHSAKTRESSLSPRCTKSPSTRGKDNERWNFGKSHDDAPLKWDGGCCRKRAIEQ
ncbi:hypothetical protein ACJRO7_035311 [Eucalyptus globulus]|uniref:Uncharacterized protein n=1 Tax=Eucalyptus globulus TaxID=34317 RepID=A0ABD3J5L7_EUCGL